MHGSFDWFLPPQPYEGDRIFSRAEIIAALDALVAVTSPDELHAVLERWQPVLCAEQTLITVCLTSASVSVKGEQENAAYLHDYLAMLEYTRKYGLDATMSILMSMVDEANSQDGVSNLDEEADKLAPLRHIELVTEAIGCIDREDHTTVRAWLHGERGDALLKVGQEQYAQLIDDFTAFLGVFTYEAVPDDWLNARGKRGLVYLSASLSNPTWNLTMAIADFDACLEKVPERDDYHKMRATLHRLRGVAHMDYNTYSNDQYHIEQAFRDFNAALALFTREQNPFEWALTYANRGMAYRGLPVKQQADTIELAIADFNTALEVFTYQDSPEEWADTCLNRGLAYTERMYGESSENVEQAIADLNKVLEVYSRETNPYKYAIAGVNLGFAYSMRMKENRVDNLAKSMQFLNEALELLTREANPLEWAAAHLTRSYVYMYYPLGERPNNLELAIKDCDAAITVYTRESRPIDWAKAGLNRTLAYTDLAKDYHKQNLDYAITDFNAILEVFTRDETPRYWGIARMNRGIAYLNRLMGVEADNLEQAVDDFNAALDIFDRVTTFQDWVMVRINRGLAYTMRVKGSAAENMDRAIADYDAVLTVLSQEQMPYFWAMTLKNRAAAYLDRINGDQAENLRQVVADCKAALLSLTKETAPREYRDFQLMLAKVYELQECWQDACVAIQEVRKAVQMLVEEATTEERRREVIGERDKPSIHLRYAMALLRCDPPDVVGAVCALEEGRAQNLRSSLELDKITLQESGNAAARARIETFMAARDAWRSARNLVSDTEFINFTAVERQTEYQRRRPHLNAAHAAFTRARDAIRQQDDPNFLLPDVTLADVARAIARPGMALVYLAYAEDSGLALIVMRTLAGSLEIEHIPLPKLTRKAVVKLMMGADEPPPTQLMQVIGGQQEVSFISGGMWLAQLGQSFEMLTMWGADVQKAMCAVPSGSTFLEAARQLLSDKSIREQQRAQLKRPFALMDVDERLALGPIFSNHVMNAELKRALPVLAELGLNEVGRTLRRWGMKDVTLIPYGFLSYFPFPAVPFHYSNGSTRRWGRLFDVTVAPCGRAKEMARERAAALDRSARPLLVTAGNPYPLPQGIGDLPYAQAEADTIRHIAEAYQYPRETIHYLRRQDVTKERVVEKLENAWYAHLAIHGRYDLEAPRQSRLVLAGNDSLPQDKRHIYLSEALDGKVNLVGLRLLVLSACETGLIDTSFAPDEALGLAAGFLQAGAAGVIASLWAVDDQATYLLMSRFAQVYLDPRRKWPPARALAEAQHWLCEEATNSILMTFDPLKEIVAATASAQLQAEVAEIVAQKEREAAVPAGLVSGVRSLRYSHKSRLAEVRLQATARAMQEPDALPYADPIFWAGFVVTGC